MKRALYEDKEQFVATTGYTYIRQTNENGNVRILMVREDGSKKIERQFKGMNRYEDSKEWFEMLKDILGVKAEEETAENTEIEAESADNNVAEEVTVDEVAEAESANAEVTSEGLKARLIENAERISAYIEKIVEQINLDGESTTPRSITIRLDWVAYKVEGDRLTYLSESEKEEAEEEARKISSELAIPINDVKEVCVSALKSGYRCVNIDTEDLIILVWCYGERKSAYVIRKDMNKND